MIMEVSLMLLTSKPTNPDWYEKLSLEDKFSYLAEKLAKHTGVNVDSCCMYWRMLVALPFDKAPAEHLPVYKAAKEYIKKELLL